MPPQQSQSNMTPEDAKASMGTATYLQNQLLHGGQDASQTQNPDQGIPQNQVTPEDVIAQVQGLESRILDEIATLKAEAKDQGNEGKKELTDLKKSIEQILNSSD